MRLAEARRVEKCWMTAWYLFSSDCLIWFSCSRDIESRSIWFADADAAAADMIDYIGWLVCWLVGLLFVF